MIRAKLNGTHAVIECDKRWKKKLYKFFSVEIPYARSNPRLRKAFKAGWDGKLHFFSNRTNRLPSGLVPFLDQIYPGVVDVVGKVEQDPREVIRSLKRFKTLKLNGIKELADFQKLTIKRMIQHGAGIIEAATNSGKTEIIAGYAKCLSPDKKVLIVIHLKSLLHQTAERIAKRIGQEVGKIGDGISDPQRITVGMVQSLPKPVKANREFYDQWDVLIMDECQHQSSNTWASISMFMKTPVRFALSGTPFTGEDHRDMRLVAAFGTKKLIKVKNKELIERGWSARPIVHVWEQRHYAPNSLKWRMAYDSMIIGDGPYNEHVISIVKKSWEQGKTTLVIVNQKNHGIRLYRRFVGEKIDCTYLTGDHSSYVVQRALRRFNDGKLGVILCTPIFDEGVDVPSIRTLVLAAGGKAPIRLLQRVGRALRRKKDGPNTAEIHDFIHYGNKYMERHSLKRMEIYLDQEFDIRFHKDEEHPEKTYTKTGEINWHRFHLRGMR